MALDNNEINGNEINQNVHYPNRKMPLDVRIIGWFVFYTAFVTFLLGGILVSGLGHFSSSEHRLILFGTVSLASELSHGIYLVCIGFVNLAGGYGVAKGYKFGWWLMLISSINFIFDTIPMFPHNRNSALICACINISIITWLVYRRRLYNIRWELSKSYKS